MEFALRQKETEKINHILSASPRILGFSVSIWNHKATLNLLKALDKTWEQRPWIILGGPEVSWLPEDAEIFNYADYIIRGEGELVFKELCEKLLSHVKPETLKFISPPPSDVSFINSAYHLYSDEDFKNKLIYVESSRGCVFTCDFCLSSLDKKLREFPLDVFLTDMDKLIIRMGKNLKGNRQQTIKFLDRSFNTNPKRVVKILEFFLEKIIKFKKNENPLCVHFEMIPFNFPLELRNLLRAFPPGSLRLELGIQTLNPMVTGLINRAGNIEESLEIISFLREETNAIIHADLIAGLPGEDIESFANGFDLLWRTLSSKSMEPRFPEVGEQTIEIQVGILKLLPGTPMARHSPTHGMVYAAEPPYEVLETSVIPMAEMDRIKNFARFWEILINRNNFPDEISRLVPQGEAVFWRFMELSDQLLKHFGQNWGIERKELKRKLEVRNEE